MTAPRPAPKQFSSFKTFAEHVATDDELLIFRRFNALNARALLSYQSELLSLEHDLAVLDQEDINDGENLETMLSAKCWETFSARSEEHGRDFVKMKTIREIQDVAFKYSELSVDLSVDLSERPRRPRL
jgi:hypothetical protein